MRKADAEALLDTYGIDPVGALTVALRTVLERPDAAWPELVAAARFADTRTAALLIGEERALDELATELNELRDVDRR